MKIVRALEEEGVKVPSPYEREIKLLLGPDKGGIEEIRANQVNLPPGGQTDYHKHDRPELIYVLEGAGICVHDGTETILTKDTLVWAEKGDMHQIKNTSGDILRLFTLFVPGFRTEKALYLSQLHGDKNR